MSPDHSDYFVTTRGEGRPPLWTWEIQRRSKPLGVRLSGGGFKSELAAKLAGEKALSELRAGLAEQRPDPRDLPRAAGEGGDTPSCPHCRRPMSLVIGLATFSERFRCLDVSGASKPSDLPGDET